MNQVEKKHPDPERANTRRKQVLDEGLLLGLFRRLSLQRSRRLGALRFGKLYVQFLDTQQFGHPQLPG